MKPVTAALMSAVRAPWAHWRLALLLWLARLLPILLLFGLPAFDKIAARSAHHPDAGKILDSAGDASGFAYAWTSDFFRDAMKGVGDTVFWLVVLSWLLVTVLSAGILTRLVHGRGLRGGLFLAECGRYAGRFLRLALIAAVLLYAVDLVCNSLLAQRHSEASKLHHEQEYALGKEWMRGVLFVALFYLVGLVHGYARIEMIAHERRSAMLSFLRGLLLLMVRLPRLLLLEFGLLLVVGAAALLAWLVSKGANPLHPDAGWPAVCLFLGLVAAASYLRTGIEVGAMDARRRILIRPAPADSIASQIETALAPADGTEGAFFDEPEPA